MATEDHDHDYEVQRVSLLALRAMHDMSLVHNKDCEFRNALFQHVSETLAAYEDGERQEVIDQIVACAAEFAATGSLVSVGSAH